MLSPPKDQNSSAHEQLVYLLSKGYRGILSLAVRGNNNNNDGGLFTQSQSRQSSPLPFESPAST
jgi:hypothetical protein